MNDQTDAQLVAAIVAGDRNAFAALYDRYADALYDVARSMLRDPHDAADAVQDVFVIASQRLDQLRDPERVRAWLFSVLRHDVYRRSARRRRTTPTDSFAETPAPVMADHEGGRLELAELARLVRDAAEGLDDRDRLVLELSVRQGLQGADLAAALGVSADQSYSIVFRMRARAERALGALVVARSNRAACSSLDHLLRDWDGRFSVLVRKRVARHIEQCDVCETHRKKVGALAAFAAAPAWAAPLALRERVLDGFGGFGGGPSPDGTAVDEPPSDEPVADRTDASPPRGGRVRASELSWAPDGFPGVARAARRGAAALVLGALVVLVVGALGVAGALSGGEGEPSTLVAGAVESRPTVTSATGPSGSSSPSPAPAPGTAPTTATAASAPVPGVAGPTMGVPADPTTTPPPAVAPPAPPVGPATTTPGPIVTTVSPSSTTTAPGATAPTTTARPPVVTPPTTTTVARVARLVVSPARADIGAVARTATFVVRNDGDAPLSWSAALAAGPLSQVAPSGGTLAPGASTTVTVVVDRANAPEGAFEGRVDLGGNGGVAQVVVAGRVERGPGISLTTSPASFPTLYTPAAGCTPTSASISAAVTDESAIASVSLHWRGPGGAPGSSAPMGQRAGRWVATLGSFATGGGLEWWVRAEDVRGNVTTTPSRTATVAFACIR